MCVTTDWNIDHRRWPKRWKGQHWKSLFMWAHLDTLCIVNWTDYFVCSGREQKRNGMIKMTRYFFFDGMAIWLPALQDDTSTENSKNSWSKYSLSLPLSYKNQLYSYRRQTAKQIILKASKKFLLLCENMLMTQISNYFLCIPFICL